MSLLRLNQWEFVQRCKAQMFALTGYKLKSRWYGAYRLLQVQAATQRPFDPANLPPQYGRWIDERIVEYPWLFSRLPDGPARLLDAGSVLNHAYVLAHPKLAQKELTIFTLAPESYWQRGVSYLYGDLRNSALRADSFDIVVCLSTLEHVGLDNTRLYTSDPTKKEADASAYLEAVRELRRVLSPGGWAFISVPYGRRDVRDWLQVFDAEMVSALVSAFSPSTHAVTFFQYSDPEGWQLSTEVAARDAVYFDYYRDTPWPGCPAAAGAVACIELRKP